MDFPIYKTDTYAYKKGLYEAGALMYNIECKRRRNSNTRRFKEKDDMEKKSVREIISVIFKAVTLAMGTSVVVLSCLGSLETQTALPLLGFGLACAGAAMLAKP